MTAAPLTGARMTADRTTGVSTAPTPPARAKWTALLLATMALVAVVAMPTPAGLSVAGQRTLAVLAFAIVVWITEAVGYALSAALAVTLGARRSGTSPSRRPPRRTCSAWG